MWALLIVTLPTQPNAVRLRIWRSLKALGCAALRDGAYLLPNEQAAVLESLAVYAPPVGIDPAARERLEVLRVAAEAHRKVHLVYIDLQQRRSERTVRPLGSFYWGAVWTLAGWCEARQAFRSFRVDRIEQLSLLDQTFRDEAGRTLADLMRAVGVQRAEP